VVFVEKVIFYLLNFSQIYNNKKVLKKPTLFQLKMFNFKNRKFMRNKLKKIRNLLAIALLIALSSCETEKLTKSVSDYNLEKPILKRVHLDEIPFIKNDILSRKQNIQGRNAADFLDLIKTDNIIVKEDLNGRKSYTFALNLEEFQSLTNLVIKETENGLKYDIVKYVSSDIDLWKESVKNNENPTIDVSIDVESLEILNSNESRPCIETTMVFMCPKEIHDIENAGSCNAEGEWHLSVQYVFVPCGGTSYATSTVPYSGQLGNSTSSGGSTPNIPQVTPCSELKKISTQDRDGIKQHITNMRNQIDMFHEHGVEFHQNVNGTFNNTVKQSTNSYYNPSIQFMAGGDTYGAVHTHPTGAFAIFSFGDIYSFSTIYNNARASSKNQATLMLACKDRAGVKHVYALKVNDIIAFNTFVNNAINAVSLDPNIGPSLSDKIRAVEIKFTDEYLVNYVDTPEKGFLQFVNNAGISILEASDDLTNWSTLSLDSPTSPLNKTPCN
jgi:hypothetical protein